MDMKMILLDVGGTFIKCSDGRQIPIDSSGSRDSIVESLREAVGEADKVAVAIPGPFDYDRGIFLMKHKFAAVYGERFADLCHSERSEESRSFGKPQDDKRSEESPSFRFIHDVNAMLLGEMAFGAGKGYDRVALVTLGTGLGFAMSLEGKLLKNEMGSPAVPIWNLPYLDGILEDYVSKRGFLRGYPEGMTVKRLSELAFQGDSKALSRFSDTGAVLAQIVEPVLEEYKIECLLFGGQISRSFALFGSAVRTGLSDIPELRYIGPVSDIDNATFNGLKTLHTI